MREYHAHRTRSTLDELLKIAIYYVQTTYLPTLFTELIPSIIQIKGSDQLVKSFLKIK